MNEYKALYFYGLAILTPALVLALFAPPLFARAALAMISSAGILALGIIALFRKFDK